MSTPDFEQHPVAKELMPEGIEGEEYDAFRADIVERGCLMPITMFEGKVLDGWNRYRVCRETGTKFSEIQYSGKDPAGYVASVNILRRKLSSLQRALVGARLHLHHDLTQRVVCKKLGISNEVINLVLKALNSKNVAMKKLIQRIEKDSDYTRGMLKEELKDAGLLRAKEDPPEEPTRVNSAFDPKVPSVLSAEAALRGITIPPDTVGSDPDEDEDPDGDPDGEGYLHPDLTVGKGKRANDRSAKAPKASAAQTLAEAFKALMLDEKVTFLQMIYPEAKALWEGLPKVPPAKGKPATPAKAPKRSAKAPAKEAA